MLTGKPRDPTHQFELLDVQLVDVFADLEALLRSGREIRRQTLRARGLPTPVNKSQRMAAVGCINKHLQKMVQQCRDLLQVISDLQGRVNDLSFVVPQDRRVLSRASANSRSKIAMK